MVLACLPLTSSQPVSQPAIIIIISPSPSHGQDHTHGQRPLDRLWKGCTLYNYEYVYSVRPARPLVVIVTNQPEARHAITSCTVMYRGVFGCNVCTHYLSLDSFPKLTDLSHDAVANRRETCAIIQNENYNLLRTHGCCNSGAFRGTHGLTTSSGDRHSAKLGRP